MTESTHRVVDAELLRREFDEAFARARVSRVDELVGFLAVRVGTTGYAIAIDEVRSLERDIVVTPPIGHHAASGLVGIAAFRGVVAPVYELGAQLGGSATSTAPRWAILAKSEQPVAFGFEKFETTAVVPRNEIVEAQGANDPALTHGVHVNGTLRRVIRLEALVATIAGRVRKLVEGG